MASLRSGLLKVLFRRAIRRTLPEQELEVALRGFNKKLQRVS